MRDFYPTSHYYDAFEHEHQILVGTRGSGRTALLRMMGTRLRSALKVRLGCEGETTHLPDDLLAFWARMSMEFLTHASDATSGGLEYFSFCFNVRACTAFAQELEDYLDLTVQAELRPAFEAELAMELARIWHVAIGPITSLRSLRLGLDRLRADYLPWDDGKLLQLPKLARTPLEPIEFVIETIRTMIFDRIGRSVVVFACIDEAEYLRGKNLKAVVSLMRSSKPYFIKLATLPGHFDPETLLEGMNVDMERDAKPLLVDIGRNEFDQLCDHLVRARLNTLPLQLGGIDDFLGQCGSRDKWFDRYASAKEPKPTYVETVAKIRDALSEQRKLRIEQGNVDRTQFEDKYGPPFYLRDLKGDVVGNRRIGFWFGSRVVRLVADCNPNRLLGLMQLMFEESRRGELRPHVQQEVLRLFAVDQLDKKAMGLDSLLTAFINEVGNKLAQRVHGPYLVDGGCGFTLPDNLLSDELFRSAIRDGIAFRHLVAKYPHDTMPTELRLAFMYCVLFWLPMRDGETVRTSANVPAPMVRRGALPSRLAVDRTRSLQLAFDDFDEA